MKNRYISNVKKQRILIKLRIKRKDILEIYKNTYDVLEVVFLFFLNEMKG